MHILRAQGQFIYSRYAFDELAKSQHWSLAALRDRLPEGLHGVFRYILATLSIALEQENQAALHTMRDKLLPCLLAAREAMAVDDLVLACGADTSIREQVWGTFATTAP